jgi:tRNA nucleotidyltransferase (CCA-adding enzyme)
MEKMHLPKNVQYIISRLNECGFRADVVGGCVRDFLLGKAPVDYDVTTNAEPEEMKRVFRKEKTIETGIKHGTLTVLISGEPYEITTYRIDGEYSDNRRPDSVSFSRELTEDLARRDFTVNAICYNEKDGYTDKFSGIDDIKKRIIRAVGDPRKRFSEDALRIMRAVRFSSVLGFTIEEQTAAAVHELKGLLKNVSKERILVEWRKLIGGEGAYRILRQYPDVIQEVIPGLESIKLPEEKLFEKASPDVREFSLFLINSKSPKDSFSFAMDILKSDSKHKKLGTSVLAFEGECVKTGADIKLLLMKIGKEAVEKLIELKMLMGEAEAELKEQLDLILKNGEAYRLSDLKIGGKELLSLGFSGEDIGTILNQLLISVIKGEVENEPESLVSAVAKVR